MKRLVVIISRLLLIGIILWFYIWTATSGDFKFKDIESASSHYKRLAISLLEGKLYIFDAPKELLELKNPYDPILNKKYRNVDTHDLALYKNKLYLYHGITPVIALYLPYKLLGGDFIKGSLAGTVFMSGNLLFAVLLIFYLKRNYFKEVPEWMMLLSIGLIGLCNLAPFLLRRPPSVYEIAISSGCFFLTGSVFWLCKAIKKPTIITLVLGSLFLGLSVGSRPQFILCGILLLVVSWKLINDKHNLSILFALFLSLFLPFTCCILMLGLYNYLRFEDITEFGQRLQIGLTDFNTVKILDVRRIISNFWIYFFNPISINSNFPFFHVPICPPELTKHIWGFERMAGMIYVVPFTFMLLLSPFIYLMKKQKDISPEVVMVFPYFEFIIIFCGFLINIFVSLIFAFQTLRYLADFMTLLILAVCIIWFYIDFKLVYFPIRRNFLRTCAVLLSIVSIVFNLAFSVVGPFHGLRHFNPALYKKLENTFNPVSNLLSEIGL